MQAKDTDKTFGKGRMNSLIYKRYYQSRKSNFDLLVKTLIKNKNTKNCSQNMLLFDN